MLSVFLVLLKFREELVLIPKIGNRRQDRFDQVIFTTIEIQTTLSQVSNQLKVQSKTKILILAIQVPVLIEAVISSSLHFKGS
jgi:hypothetical protein